MPPSSRQITGPPVINGRSSEGGSGRAADETLAAPSEDTKRLREPKGRDAEIDVRACGRAGGRRATSTQDKDANHTRNAIRKGNKRKRSAVLRCQKEEEKSLSRMQRAKRRINNV